MLYASRAGCNSAGSLSKAPCPAFLASSLDLATATMSSDACVTGHFTTQSAARGEETRIADLPSYLVRPDGKPTVAVVIVTDVFGYTLPNTRVIADRLAAEGGVLAVVPDLLEGDPLPVDRVGIDLVSWMSRHSDTPKILGQLHRVVTALKADHGVRHVVAQGYCWGGKYAILAGTKGSCDEEPNPFVDAFVAAHPSRVEVPSHIEAIATPGLFLFSETDKLFTPEVIGRVKSIVEANHFDVEIKQFPGTNHGFAVRGDEADPVVGKAKEEALQAGIAFVKAKFATA